MKWKTTENLSNVNDYTFSLHHFFLVWVFGHVECESRLQQLSKVLFLCTSVSLLLRVSVKLNIWISLCGVRNELQIQKEHN